MFTSMMHIAFFTDQMDEMLDFYVNKLGAEIKVLTRYKSYLNRPDRPDKQEIARKDPERIFNVYLQLAQGQFIELFPKKEGQKAAEEPNSHLGYSHYALLVGDIFETRRKLEKKGCSFDTDISKGPSETWQMWMHDPDGNRFEIMQFTDKSYQVIGHAD